MNRAKSRKMERNGCGMLSAAALWLSLAFLLSQLGLVTGHAFSRLQTGEKIAGDVSRTEPSRPSAGATSLAARQAMVFDLRSAGDPGGDGAPGDGGFALPFRYEWNWPVLSRPDVAFEEPHAPPRAFVAHIRVRAPPVGRA